MVVIVMLLIAVTEVVWYLRRLKDNEVHKKDSSLYGSEDSILDEKEIENIMRGLGFWN